MNPKILLTGLVFLCFLFSGCFEPPAPKTEMPENFEFSYGTGAMHLEWGHYRLEVDASGQATFEKGQGIGLSKTSSFNASKEDRKKIFEAITKNNFFSLNDSYTDPSIMDGGWSQISVQSGGESKTVRVNNAHNESFEKIEVEIVNLIKSKLGVNAFGFEDLREDCSAKQIECKGIESIECEDWKNYCGWEDEPGEDEEKTFELSVENCDKQENRMKCIEACSVGECEEEICDVLMFDVPGCTECGPGCCAECNGLDECVGAACEVMWVHPSGESWQYGGCGNMNYCMTPAEECELIFNYSRGYSFHAVIDEDPEKREEYTEMAEAFDLFYGEQCQAN